MKGILLSLLILFFFAPQAGVSQTIGGTKVDCSTIPDPDWSFDQNACTPKTIQFYSDSANVLLYHWEFGDGVNSTLRNPLHTYKNYGTYTVKLTITYIDGCIKMADIKRVAITADIASLVKTKDTEICLGESVILAPNGNDLDSCWEPNISLTKINGGYLATPKSTTTYIFKVQSTGENLISNGNFNQKNFTAPIGFFSDYEFVPWFGYKEGWFTVTTDPNNWHPNFSGCGDHTTGDGNMMVVNGADTPNVRVWYTTVDVKPNTNYLFSTWLQTVNNFENKLAKLQFSINGQVIGLPFDGNAKTCVWDEFFTTWNSGTKSKATISILNLSTAPNGNDFALDDIFFGEVLLQTDSTTVKVNDPTVIKETVTICKGHFYTLPSKAVVNASGNYTSSFKTATGCDSIITTTLIVLDAIKATENVSICAGASYKLPSGVLAGTQGVYTSNLKSLAGCDSIITTTLIVLDAIKATENVSICAGASYKLPSGVLAGTQGVYTSNLKSLAGCDSIITTTLIVLDAIKATENVSICAGASYKLPSGVLAGTQGVYTSNLKSLAGCDSIITTTLIVLDAIKATENVSICAGASYKLPSGVLAGTQGVYTSNLKSLAGCDSIITTTLIVLDAIKATENVSICAGASYKLPSGVLAGTQGVYTSNLKSLAGCDSIITTTLIVLDAIKATENVSICAGASYKLPSGRVVSISGSYVDSIKTVAGCDSIVTVNLAVGSAITVAKTAAICQGESYTLPSGKIVNTSGTYVDSVKTISGCDSIITTNLTIIPAKTETIAASICSGQSFKLPSGRVVSISGSYVDSIETVAGCDSIVTVNLAVGSAITVAKTAAICPGESYTLPSGKIVNTSGTYVDSVKTISGCDSIITTNLTIIPAKTETIAASICSGQSYKLPSGKVVSISGSYVDSIKTVAGCDSIVTVNLAVGSAITVAKTAAICPGEKYTLPSGKIVNTSGTYVDSVKTNSGCDSIITTNLTITPAKKEIIAASICSGQSYQLPSGRVVSVSGSYVDSIKTVAGCDSIVTVNLAVGSAITVAKTAAICPGESYTLPSGKIVNTSGGYIDSMKTISGCDSIITTNLTIIPAKTETIAASICSGQSYKLPSGKVVSISGSYVDSIKTVNGCDSIVTVNLAVGSAVTIAKTAAICPGESYTLPSGKIVNTAGTYVDSVKTVSGCDSIITTNLTITEAKKETIAASICSGQSYKLLSGKVVSISGSYVDSLKTVNGCDSIVTVNLAVGSAVTIAKTAAICPGESYTLPSGKIVNTAGTYVDSVKTVSGCDSIITTNLTITEAKKETIAASICSGQSYKLPSGKVVSISGSYVDSLKTVNGCDSIVTVNLAVGSAVTVAKTAAICQGESYTLPSGKIVNTSGIYVDSVKTISGCDSIVKVTLTVLEVKKETLNISLCTGQTYTLPSGKTINTSGIYIETIKSSNGCDSTVTVNLKMGASIITDRVATICVGQSYTLSSGRIVWAQGMYSETYKSASGCDSIVRTSLKIMEPQKQNISTTLCEGRSYVLPSGASVNKAGTYTDVLKSATGCDSLITVVNLTITGVARSNAKAAICEGEKYVLPWGKIAGKAGVYTDTVRNVFGCDSILTSITLQITQKPKLVLSKSNDINCILGVATLSASGAARYIWSPTNSVTSIGGTTNVVAPQVTTRYKVQAFSKEGCVSEDSIDVIVTKGDADGGYLLPSAFTPNGDGKNDCFGVKSWGMVADLDFSVFNRWGVLLFHTKDASQCWDGTYKGVPQNSGTYVYQVFGTTSCGPVYRKNTIVLIR